MCDPFAVRKSEIKRSDGPGDGRHDLEAHLSKGGGIGAMERGEWGKENNATQNLASGGTTTSTTQAEKLWRKHRQFYYSLYLFIKKSNKHLVRQKKLFSAVTLVILCLGFTVLVWYNRDKLVLFLEWLRSIGMWGNVLFVFVFIIVGFPFMLGYIPLTVRFVLTSLSLPFPPKSAFQLNKLIYFTFRLGRDICMEW